MLLTHGLTRNSLSRYEMKYVLMEAAAEYLAVLMVVLAIIVLVVTVPFVVIGMAIDNRLMGFAHFKNQVSLMANMTGINTPIKTIKAIYAAWYDYFYQHISTLIK